MAICGKDIDSWCENHAQEQLDLLKTLAAIPAPSHHEEKRAEFIRSWLESQGAEGVFIDDAKNVFFPYRCENADRFPVYMAHTDVVFPDTTPLPVLEDESRLWAPGVGDDTANVTALMLSIKFLLTHPGCCSGPILFVFNSCEEGLGNLKGVRAVMDTFGSRVRELISFDCQSDSIVTRAVGSERWEVKVSTISGHSYSDFGNPNAIAQLSRLVSRLYDQPVPVKANTKTTFNVGLISGGTSVNTIAQEASMTYEYRSDDRECLAVMARQFHNIVGSFSKKDAEITVRSIGNRPCGGKIDENTQNLLIQRCREAIRRVYGNEPALCSASTDANIPLSMGIPAATFGLYRGGGAHTRQEYVDLDSLTPGLKIVLTFLLSENITD